MINAPNVQAALIAELKAATPLVDWLGGSDSEIREENWMGQDYAYPSIRLGITRHAPVYGTSNCKFYECEFNVTARATGTSSEQSSQGMTLSVQALEDVRLSGVGFVSESAIVLNNASGPLPEGEKQWMCRAFFRVRLKEV